MIKILNLKLMILLEYQNIKKNVLANRNFPNRSEECFVIKEIKNTVPWTYVSNDLKN